MLNRKGRFDTTDDEIGGSVQVTGFVEELDCLTLEGPFALQDPSEAQLRQFARKFKRAELEANRPPEKRKNLESLTWEAVGCVRERVPATEGAQLADLCRKLVMGQGKGLDATLKLLYSALTRCSAPELVPFWNEQLAIKIVRDRSRKLREFRALVGLAAILREHPGSEAQGELVRLTGHGDPLTRARAICVLDLGMEQAGVEWPQEIQTAVLDRRANDPSPGVRFVAATACRDRSLAQCDKPEGAVDLKVVLAGHEKSPRTIRIRADQWLDELHCGIQEAFGWDGDHLYSFYVGEEKDSMLEIKGTTPMGDFYDDTGRAKTRGDDAPAKYPSAVDEFLVGWLSLRPKDRLLYLFDYGDDHRFHLEVVAVHPKAPRGRFPAVLEKVGKAPKQYPRSDW